MTYGEIIVSRIDSWEGWCAVEEYEGCWSLYLDVDDDRLEALAAAQQNHKTTRRTSARRQFSSTSSLADFASVYSEETKNELGDQTAVERVSASFLSTAYSALGTDNALKRTSGT